MGYSGRRRRRRRRLTHGVPIATTTSTTTTITPPTTCLPIATYCCCFLLPISFTFSSIQTVAISDQAISEQWHRSGVGLEHATSQCTSSKQNGSPSWIFAMQASSGMARNSALRPSATRAWLCTASLLRDSCRSLARASRHISISATHWPTCSRNMASSPRTRM